MFNFKTKDLHGGLYEGIPEFAFCTNRFGFPWVPVEIGLSLFANGLGSEVMFIFPVERAAVLVPAGGLTGRSFKLKFQIGLHTTLLQLQSMKLCKLGLLLSKSLLDFTFC